MTPTVTRRRLIRTGTGLALSTPAVAAAFVAGCGEEDTSTETTPPTPASQEGPRDGDEALGRLLAGNERFAADRERNLGRDTVRRAELAEEQKPYAVILGCADSRVPPEVVFDQGLGDLFVVRIAGNTAVDPFVVGSIEYAVEHLGSVLVMVLGHQSCGAVKGAIAVVNEGAEEPGSIGDFIAPIVPVVEGVTAEDRGLSESRLVERSIRANVSAAVDELESGDSLVSELADAGKLKVVGAEYQLETGRVVLL